MDKLENSTSDSKQILNLEEFKRIIMYSLKQDKIDTANSILQLPVVSVGECGLKREFPETKPSLEGRALVKMSKAHKSFPGELSFGMATDLSILAFNGGPERKHSKYNKTNKNGNLYKPEFIIDKMKGINCRKATFSSALAIWYPNYYKIFRHNIYGTISEVLPEDAKTWRDIFIPNDEVSPLSKLKDPKFDPQIGVLNELKEWLNNPIILFNNK